MLTQKRLKELLAYDPATGILTRLIRTSNCVHIGDVAGRPQKQGYLRIMIDGASYLVHRLAFLYMTGKWPKAGVDHINLNKTDNRWLNLREATKAQNSMNRCAPANNTSGYKGVHWDKQNSKWRARIKVSGKSIHIGLFNTKKEAHYVYAGAAEFYFGSYARAA